MECKHEWRVYHEHFAEGCIGAICISCGYVSCGCAVLKQHGDTMPQSFWQEEDVKNYKNRRNKICCG